MTFVQGLPPMSPDGMREATQATHPQGADGEMRAARQVSPVSNIVSIYGIVLIVLLLLAAAMTIYVQRLQAIESYRANLPNLSRLLAEHARQSIAAADLVQKSIADRVLELGVEDDRGLRQVLGSRAIFDMLNDKVGGLPQIDVATVVAANGDVVNFTRSYPPPPINLADRDYFKAHFTDPDLRFFLSLPVRNRGTGQWTFYLTRKIKNSAGETIGLVLTGLGSGFFSDYYRAVSFSEFSAISLYRADGGLMARSPEADDSMGKILSQPGLEAVKAGVGSFITNEPRLVDQSDSRFRIVAPREVSGYPLVVIVTATEELVFAEWRHRAVLIGGGAVALSLICAALMWWISQLLNNREAARTSARQAHERAAMIERLAEIGRLEALGSLAGGVAHEINTPAQFIGDNISFIRDWLPRLLDIVNQARSAAASGEWAAVRDQVVAFKFDFAARELPAAADQALDGVKRISAIVQAIKAFSYPSGKTPQPFDLNLAIETALTVTRSQWKNVAEIVCDLAHDLPRLNAIEGEVNQILVNLIVNAAQAIGQAERPQPGRITVRTRAINDFIELAIADTGVGIPQENLDRLFELFFTTKAPGEGTGQGLAITKAIVHRHGGTIKVKSEPGVGTCFEVLLPIGGSPEQSSKEVA